MYLEVFMYIAPKACLLYEWICHRSMCNLFPCHIILFVKPCVGRGVGLSLTVPFLVHPLAQMEGRGDKEV